MSTEALPPVICLMGPTAAGKTAVAFELVENLPLEIVSVDSVMIYKEMNIGSAKPTEDELKRAPHRLIDFLDPSLAYSAANFRDDAVREIEDILAHKRIPLLVGGTMLYFRALFDGLAKLPAADEAIRAELETQAKEQGWQVMHDRLKQIDPVAAEKIHPNDPQRIQRALEVYEITGTPMSVLQQQTAHPAPFQFIKRIVCPEDRAVLHARIEQRFHQMLEQGLIQEVEALYQRGDLNLSMPSMRAVGYRQVWELLAGETDYESMVEKGIAATRQLAKRQLTWLRSEPDCLWFNTEQPDVARQVLKSLSDVHIQ